VTLSLSYHYLLRAPPYYYLLLSPYEMHFYNKYVGLLLIKRKRSFTDKDNYQLKLTERTLFSIL